MPARWDHDLTETRRRRFRPGERRRMFTVGCVVGAGSALLGEALLFGGNERFGVGLVLCLVAAVMGMRG